MQTALITGSTRGIGLEIARQLAQLGFRVYLSGRNEALGRKVTAELTAAGWQAVFIPLDVADLASIRRAFETVAGETDTLNVLINNAGVQLDENEDLLHEPPAAVRQTLEINALGPLFVTQTLAPLLKSGSRVIMVSSGAGQICAGMSGYAPAYSVSKVTLNAITIQLALALKARGIVVNAVSPGWVRTDMGGSMAPRSVEKGAETPVWLATEAPLKHTGQFWQDKKVISW